MKELGMSLLACLVIGIFFVAKVYPNLEYKNGERNTSCIGECYEKYVKINGTPSQIEQRKRAAAMEDPYSSIKGLWSGCAACHGAEGQGMGAFPRLAGQNADYIYQRLQQYKNRETVGSMSSTMWAQAGMLSDDDMKTIGKFIEETMK